MQRLGILVDVSHLSVPGVMNVLAIAERPVVASHSNARALCPHLRNLPDEAIAGIAATGGLIGVCPYPGFIDATNPSLSRLLDHVDYLVRLVGEDHIAIGADFIDYMQETVRERLLAANVGYLSDTTYPDGIESVRDFPNLTAGLIDRGYGEPAITKMLGENYLRVLAQSI
jgi:membrane dipeptidase